jgi:DNA gyrase/topoisomerase IV subunit B
MKSPEYDSQAKTRLTAPDLRKDFVDAITSQWKPFAKKNEQWLANVIERAERRHKHKEDKDAIAEHEQNKKRRSVAKLLDATSRIRSECQLLIAEGDSATAQISEARNPKTTASYWLGGKINNVYGCSVAQVLKMDKLKDLLAIIGLTPGKKAIRSQLNYGRIVIASDADYDGDDIFTLLVNLFYQFWPELFDKNYEPFIYRLVAPNVVVSKGGKRVHFSRRPEYEKVKDKYKGWTVEYMKGLGSMWKEDWEMVLSGDSDTFIPIIDDGQIKPTLELLFSDNADARKVWLTKNDK